jgi:hypothetical protein
MICTRIVHGRWIGPAVAAFAALLSAGIGYGSTIDTTPSGLAPGTKYQLVFVTSDGFFATSTSISTYNTDVTTEAGLDPQLATFDTANGVTWTVIGSTPTVNADSNAPSTGLVYTLDGTEVASSSSSLYSGSLLAPIDINENGAVEAGYDVWTGSTSGGTYAGGINGLGQTFPEYGSSSSTAAAWITSSNGIESNNNIPLYALSSVITVPYPSAVPEPATVALFPTAMLLLFGIYRLRRNRPGVDRLPTTNN